MNSTGPALVDRGAGRRRRTARRHLAGGQQSPALRPLWREPDARRTPDRRAAYGTRPRSGTRVHDPRPGRLSRRPVRGVGWRGRDLARGVDYPHSWAHRRAPVPGAAPARRHGDPRGAGPGTSPPSTARTSWPCGPPGTGSPIRCRRCRSGCPGWWTSTRSGCSSATTARSGNRPRNRTRPPDQAAPDRARPPSARASGGRPTQLRCLRNATSDMRNTVNDNTNPTTQTIIVIASAAATLPLVSVALLPFR